MQRNSLMPQSMKNYVTAGIMTMAGHDSHRIIYPKNNPSDSSGLTPTPPIFLLSKTYVSIKILSLLCIEKHKLQKKVLESWRNVTMSYILNLTIELLV